MARIRIRATINLAGLPRGTVAEVDPDDPYIADAIRAGYLIPLELPGEDRAPDIPPDLGPAADRDETDAVVPPA